MIAILAAVIMGVALSYYSIMVAKLSKETYQNIASDIAESTAQVVNVEDIKTFCRDDRTGRLFSFLMGGYSLLQC